MEEEIIDIDTDILMADTVPVKDARMSGMDCGTEETPVTRPDSKTKLALDQLQLFANTYCKHTYFFYVWIVVPKLQRPIDDTLKQCRMLIHIFQGVDESVIIMVMKGEEK